MPANIDRLVAERERLARNSAIVTGMMKTQQVSDWHERQYHRTGGPTVGERQADEAELELQMANASVHELRRAKMRELVARDDFIQPANRRQEVRNFVAQGLRDFSISRVNVSWGLPVPGHDLSLIHI